MARKTRDEIIADCITGLEKLGKIAEANKVRELLEKGEGEKAYNRARWEYWRAKREAGLTKPRPRKGKSQSKPEPEPEPEAQVDTVNIKEVNTVIENPDFKLLTLRLMESGFTEENARKMAAAIQPQLVTAKMLRVTVVVYATTVDEAVAKATALITGLGLQEAQEVQETQEAQDPGDPHETQG